MADGIRQVVAAWTSEQARELRTHVERDLSWPQTVRALERAYMSSRIG